MKYCKLIIGLLFASATMWTACDDACEYLDTDTSNPSWVQGYEEGDEVSHPESMANTVWTRGSGLKYNAYGEEVQGFVESMNFFCADSVIVVMSEGCTSGTWTDESNTEKVPCYEYTYSVATGTVQVLKSSKDDSGKVSKSVIFTGVATQGKKEVLTVCHFGDTPVQSYLVKQ
ncbi:MAG: hypothetical protein K6E86_07585 [Bacteroidales bacterium]|nr:hypothetical protein [Bacteroidales bacterium]